MAISDKFHLSQPQRRIWNIEKIHQGTPIHCIGGVTVFNGGEIDLDILQSAFMLCLQNNNVFRLQLLEKEGDPWQYFCDETYSPTVERLDFSGHCDPLDVFYKWAKAIFITPFDLAGHPLFHVAVARVKDGQAAFFLKFHHIILDGWSISLFIAQAYHIYKELSGKGDKTAIKTGEYQSLVVEEENYLKSEEFLKDKEFWFERFKHLKPNIPDVLGRDLAGKRKQFDCPKQLSELLLSFTAENHISVNLLFIAIVLFYQHRHTGRKELVVGIPLLNRNNSNHKRTIGMYTSTMPLLMRFSGNISIKELLTLVKEELKKCYQHQKYPYNFLVQDLELRKKQAGGLFNVCVNYYATKLPGTFEGAQTMNDEFYCGYQPYDLQVSVKEWGNSLQFQYDYRTGFLTDFEIDCLNETIVHLASLFCTCDDRILDNIDMLSDHRNKEIGKDFERIGTDRSSDGYLLDFWARLSADTNDSFVLDEDGRSLTRGDFYLNVIKLSGYLRKCGVMDQDRVGILMSHSIECIVAIMAVMASGAVIVPMDPGIPVGRMSYILGDTRSKLVITNLEGLTDFGIPVLRYADIPFDTLKEEYSFSRTSGIDLAYIMYTSGSTGRPKGVAITHENLINYCKWAADRYVRPAEEVFAFFTSIGFDLTITSLFVPMISRSKIKVFFPDREDSRHVLFRVFGSKEVTAVKCTPSHLALLQDHPVHKNRNMRLIIGGEDLKTNLAHIVMSKLGGDTELFNEYGPTEATVGCMIHKFDAHNDNGLSVPIGRPINNTSIYLLDDHLRHVPLGTSGEIYIGGNSVSPGYWNSPKLNEERFVQSPWDSSLVLYRTGDIGRFGKGYEIIYDGRADQQVKINGGRVELREIESVLASHESIRQVFLRTCQSERDETSGTRTFIVAYLIVNELYSPDAVKFHLGSRLPGYMIPAYFITMSDFPLNSNGKVDVHRLPPPVAPLPVSDPEKDGFTPDESLVTLAVKELLHLDTVDPADNFFSIGGDSIAAIRLSSRLQSMGFSIPPQAILKNPVLGKMTKIVLQSANIGNEVSRPDKLYRDFSTPTIDWFFDQEFGNPEYYHQSVLLDMKLELHGSQLNGIFRRLITCHDSLRIVVRSEQRAVGYAPELSPDKFAIEEYPIDERVDLCAQFVSIGEKVKKSISFNDDFLFRVVLFNGSEGRQWVLLIFHHLLVDAVSWDILLGQLRLSIECICKGITPTLQSEKTLWCDWALRLAAGRSRPASRLVPAARIDAAVKQYTLEGDMDAGDRARLLRKTAGAYGVGIHELLLSIFLLAWNKVTGQKKIILVVERHGRDLGPDLPDISNTIGWFTVFDPVCAEIAGGSLSESFESLKQQIRGEAPLPMANERSLRFNFLGSFFEADNAYFKISEMSTGADIDPQNSSSSGFEFNCWIVQNKLCFRIVYDTVLAPQRSAEHLVKAFEDIFKLFSDDADLYAGLSKDDLVSLFM